MISINTLLKSVYDNQTYRILWISKEQDIVYVFDTDKCSMPYEMKYAWIIQQINDGDLQSELYDPFVKAVPEEEITDKARDFRDRIWALMESVVLDEPGIYEKQKRSKLISDKASESGKQIKSIHRYLKQYWLCGKNKNAFLSGYSNSGGKGNNRTATSDSVKRGRPRKYSDDVGINIDAETKCIFEKAINKFYHTRNEYTFKSAYEMMLKKYYTKSIKQSDGTVKIELMPPNEIPTLTQFRYWYSKTYDIKAKVSSRKGESKYSLDHRAILGKSDYGIMGPGAKYQIDATVGDIYLVSRYNRANIIGRPVIYFVIDVFSRMVTGIYVGLEGPSWAGAMMAIANASSDKVKYCAEYGVEINESDWPCHHIPEAILGDRGEMESKSVETLINSLNVRIENTPPYRADMKGIVEQHFKTINTSTVAFLPGYVKPDMMKRGGKDYRLDATLDLHQFTKIIILSVLNHNKEHLLESFERDADMIADEVLPIPAKLWEWGIRNRSGLLRTYPEELIKLCLMPTGTATVSAKGIRFKGIYYLSDRAISERWFETARAKGSFRVDVSYDPRNMNCIYTRPPDEKTYDICYLAEWEDKYLDRRLEEIIYLHESEKQMSKFNEKTELETRINLSSEIEKVVNEAKQLNRQADTSSSKSERTKNIRTNRTVEKEQNRNTEAFVLGDTGNSKIEVPETEDNDISPIMKMIVKDLEERRNE